MADYSRDDGWDVTPEGYPSIVDPPRLGRMAPGLAAAMREQQAASQPEESLAMRGLHGLSTILGLPGAAVMAGARQVGKLEGLDLPPELGRGEAIREAFGLSTNPLISDNNNTVGRRLAGGAAQFAGDIATDPLTPFLGASRGVAGKVASALFGAGVPAELPAIGRAAAAAFLPGMAEGAIKGGQGALQAYREGNYPQAAESALSGGLSAGFGALAGMHALHPGLEAAIKGEVPPAEAPPTPPTQAPPTVADPSLARGLEMLTQEGQIAPQDAQGVYQRSMAEKAGIKPEPQQLNLPGVGAGALDLNFNLPPVQPEPTSMPRGQEQVAPPPTVAPTGQPELGMGVPNMGQPEAPPTPVGAPPTEPVAEKIQEPESKEVVAARKFFQGKGLIKPEELKQFLQDAANKGVTVTKPMLEKAGLWAANQKHSIPNFLRANGLGDWADRAQEVKGKGFNFAQIAPEAISKQSNAEVPPAAPAPPAVGEPLAGQAPATLAESGGAGGEAPSIAPRAPTRQEMIDQLTPEKRASVVSLLEDHAKSLGVPLHELTKAQVAELVPGDTPEAKTARQGLYYVLGGEKALRERSSDVIGQREAAGLKPGEENPIGQSNTGNPNAEEANPVQAQPEAAAPAENAQAPETSAIGSANPEPKAAVTASKPTPGALTLDRAKEALPGLKIEDHPDGGFRADLPNGGELRINQRGEIEVADSEALKASREAAGAPEGEVRGSYTKLGKDRLISVVDPKSTVDHEAYHMYRELALNDRERASASKKYGDEESEAYAYEKWKQTRQAPNSWFSKIYSYAKQLVHKLRPTWESTFEEIASGRAGERLAKGESSGETSTVTDNSPRFATSKKTPEERTSERRDSVGKGFIEDLAALTGTKFTAPIEKSVKDALANTKEVEPPKVKGNGVDLAKNANRLIPKLPAAQQEILGAAVSARNATYGQAKPVTWADIANHSDARDMTGAKDEAGFNAWVKKHGISDPADIALLTTVDRELGGGIVDARRAMIEAEKSGDKAALDSARQDVAYHTFKRIGAMDMLTPDTGIVGRLHDFYHDLGAPLEEGEAFKDRFTELAKRYKIKPEQADKLYQMVEDTANEGGAGNWSALEDTFKGQIKPSLWDKGMEVFRAILLGWPSVVAKGSTDVGFRVQREFENATAIGADITASKLSGRESKRAWGELGARKMGIMEALNEGRHDFLQDMKDIVALRPLRGHEPAFLGESRYGKAIEGPAGEFLGTSFKLMDAITRYAKHVARNAEIAADTRRLAMDEGNRSPGESVNDAAYRMYKEARRAMSDPASNQRLLAKYDRLGTLRRANDAAKLDTMTADFDPTAKKINEALSAAPFQVIAPFRKVPYNLMKEGLKRTPFGIAHAAIRAAKGELSHEQFTEEAAKGVISTIVMAGASQALLKGVITGGGPADPGERREWQATHQPYSIKLPNNTWLSYQRIEPLATPLSLAADLAEAWRDHKMQNAEQIQAKLHDAFKEVVLNKSFFENISNMMDLLTDPKKAGQAAKNLEGSLVPNTIGMIPFAHATRAFDPYMRETSATDLSAIQSRIPFLSNQLKPRMTSAGVPVEREGTPFERVFSPFKRVEKPLTKDALTHEELARVGYAPPPPKPYLTGGRFGEDKVYLTSAEQDQLAKAQQRAFQSLTRVVNSSRYQRAPDEGGVDIRPGQQTKKQMLEGEFSRYRNPVLDRIRMDALRRARAQSTGQAGSVYR